MNISLADLMILEDRLTADRGEPCTRRLAPGSDGIFVSWAVSARATLPHLPILRGGEVLLLPARVSAVVAEDLPALAREAERRKVSAIVLEAGDPAADRTALGAGLAVHRWAGEISSDTETTINRLLTECRGNLYQVGSDLERQMADAAANRANLGDLLAAVSRVSGLPVAVTDAKGRRLGADPECDERDNGLESAFDRQLFEHALPMNATLVVGPVLPAQRVMARFLIDRIAAATAAALQRDESARPRGARRAEATEALLSGHSGSASDQRAAALALGLDPDSVFFVAVSDAASESAMASALAPLGSIHAAGSPNGRRATLVAATGRKSAESYSDRVLEVKRRWATEHARHGSLLALSAPAVGVASVPAAAREAQFVATLQSRAQLPHPAASFASIADVGAMGLLYQVRDSSELRRFVTEALGSLEARDQRGTLRETLRAFFESGGSQVDASQRLGIHRNTLAYRLRRIGELVGRDVADPGSWLTLHLALRASEMLEVCSDER